MTDRQIIELYLQRSEAAVRATQEKYGRYCLRIAQNILGVPQDAEECVNDVWLAAWKRIPPLIPVSLKAFCGKLVRDAALSRYRADHARKRYAGMELLLNELEECVPSAFDVEQNFEVRRLSEQLERWLGTLAQESRVLFVRRYYHGESVKSLAKEWGVSENAMAQRMLRLRAELRAVLEKEEIIL